MEWWVWLLIAVVLVLAVLLFWWWWRSRAESSAPTGPPMSAGRPISTTTDEMSARSVMADESASMGMGSESGAMAMASGTTAMEADAAVEAEVAEEAEEAEPSPASSARDDLTMIEGIGPKIASVLSAAGIATFGELAECDTGRIQRILDDADLRLAKPDTWPAQARLAADGDMDGLRRLQDELTAGRS